MRRSIATALTLMGVVSTACLVTDPIDQRQPTSPEQNHAPRFKDSTDNVAPWAQPVVIKFEVGSAQQSCIVFPSIRVVEDEDVDDEVVAKWFVDGKYQSHEILLQTTTTARLGPQFKFDAGDFPDSSTWAGYHFVEVVISDGFADRQDTGIDAGDSNDPTTEVQEGKGSVRKTWIIDTRNATQCSNGTGGSR